MRTTWCWAGIALLAVCAGCQTTGDGIYSVPVARDYGELTRTDIADAEAALETARLLGGPFHAPYEYHSAERYLDMARERKRRQDRLGAWDYAGLAKSMAEAASRRSPQTPSDIVATPAPASLEACQAEFERVKARYLELNREKAREVAPFQYAKITASLSGAELDLANARRWRHAAHTLRLLEADIDALWEMDSDGDGIPDMKDLAPHAPEDMDGFQDDDGVPDPDNDNDGIPDSVDVAPLEPETRNRWHDYDGAPDEYPELESLPFAAGSATISPESRGYLRGIAQLLIEWPELKLHVKGYTDDSHSLRYNMDLSRRRAQRVQEYLIEQGVDEGQIVVSFHGHADPVSDGASEAERMRNHRVELTLE